MKTALITGITGQDGSYLAEFLLEKGYEVYGLVRRSSNPRMDFIKGLPIRLIYGDMLDSESLRLALRTSKPHEVYNLAAQTHVQLSFQQPDLTLSVNCTAVANLLNTIVEVDRDIRLYQASTSEMFGNTWESPQNEDTPMYPISPYGIAKLGAHRMVAMCRESHNLHASSGILFNHESPRRGIDFVTRKITDGVARIYCGLQDKITLGNIYACRDWGFAGDYVKAMWLMLQQDRPDDYVIATGESHSVLDFVKEAFYHEDWQRYVNIDEKLFRPVEINNLVGDASKAKEVLGWKPQVSFSELVSMMVESDIRRVQRED